MAGLARCCLDLHGSRRNLGNFKFEEPLDQPGVASTHHDLWTLGRLADLHDVGLEARAMLVALVGNLFRLRQEGFDLSEVEQRVAIVGLLDDAGDDVTLATCILFVLEITLDLTNALQDDLLGRLSGDPAEVVGSIVPLPGDVAVLVEFLSVDANLARVWVDGDNCLLGRVGAPLVGSYQRVGQGVEQRLHRDALVASDLS